MVDAIDSKSIAGNCVSVRVRPPADFKEPARPGWAFDFIRFDKSFTALSPAQ